MKRSSPRKPFPADLVRTLAADLGLPKNEVRKALRGLEEKDIIRRIKDDPTTYAIVPLIPGGSER